MRAYHLVSHASLFNLIFYYLSRVNMSIHTTEELINYFNEQLLNQLKSYENADFYQQQLNKKLDKKTKQASKNGPLQKFAQGLDDHKKIVAVTGAVTGTFFAASFGTKAISTALAGAAGQSVTSGLSTAFSGVTESGGFITNTLLKPMLDAVGAGLGSVVTTTLGYALPLLLIGLFVWKLTPLFYSGLKGVITLFSKKYTIGPKFIDLLPNENDGPLLNLVSNLLTLSTVNRLNSELNSHKLKFSIDIRKLFSSPDSALTEEERKIKRVSEEDAENLIKQINSVAKKPKKLSALLQSDDYHDLLNILRARFPKIAIGKDEKTRVLLAITAKLIAKKNNNPHERIVFFKLLETTINGNSEPTHHMRPAGLPEAPRCREAITGLQTHRQPIADERNQRRTNDPSSVVRHHTSIQTRSTASNVSHVASIASRSLASRSQLHSRSSSQTSQLGSRSAFYQKKSTEPSPDMLQGAVMKMKLK